MFEMETKGINISNLSSTSTEVTATVEIQLNAEPGQRQVSVTTAGGESNLLPFTIEETTPLEITGLNPNSLELLNPPTMPYTFGMDISGTGLATAEAVVFSSGDFTAEITSASATQVSAEVTVAIGAGFGNREVTVQTASGVTNSLTFEFRQLVPRPGKVGKKVGGRLSTPSPQPQAPSPDHSNPEPRTLNPEPQISWDQTFTYDRFGNLTATVEGGQQRSIAVNAQNNRLNGPGMVYDAAGNLIEDNGKLYTYDGTGCEF